MRSEKSSDTIEDLYHKKIMMESNAGDLRAMMHRSGLIVDRLNIVDRPSNAESLLEKEGGAISAYLTDEPYILGKKQIPFLSFSPRTYGVDFYGDYFFTTQSLVKKDREMVKRFREATLKGWGGRATSPRESH